MIRIICPSNNIPERRYAIEVLFNDLLGCDLSADDILFDAQAVNYTIQVDGKEIVVEDHFFQPYVLSQSRTSARRVGVFPCEG